MIRDLPKDTQAVLSRDEDMLLTFDRDSNQFVIRDAMTGTERLRRMVPGSYVGMPPRVFATTNSVKPFIVAIQVTASWRATMNRYRSEWLLYDLLNGVELGRVPMGSTADSNLSVTPDGEQVACIDLLGSKLRHHLLIYDFPLQTPWTWIATITLLASILAIAKIESLVIWRDGGVVALKG